MDIYFYETRETKKNVIHLIGVQITDSESYLQKMLDVITDTSWISRLDKISQRSYKACAAKTIPILSSLFQDAVEPISGEVGEYIVSLSSLDILEFKLKHKPVPLSEIWKSRAKGNDGFDFHTHTDCGRLNFGEAKFNRSQHSYSKAANQILKFIKDNKDDADLIHLRNIIQEKLMEEKIDKKEFYYSIAFSINGKDTKEILENALNSMEVKTLLKKTKVFFLIGVKIASV